MTIFMHASHVVLANEAMSTNRNNVLLLIFYWFTDMIDDNCSDHFCILSD